MTGDIWFCSLWQERCESGIVAVSGESCRDYLTEKEWRGNP
jgi:hypothetical protein